MEEKTRVFRRAFRESGRRVTSQRSLLLDLLRQSRAHLDAETLFIKAKKRDPRISLATVYRTLAILKEAGLVEENRLGEAHSHFEAVKKEPHFHFTCTTCGRVIEFQTPLLSRFKDDLEKKEDVQVRDIHIYASGYCTRCQ